MGNGAAVLLPPEGPEEEEAFIDSLAVIYRQDPQRCQRLFHAIQVKAVEESKPMKSIDTSTNESLDVNHQVSVPYSNDICSISSQ